MTSDPNLEQMPVDTDPADSQTERPTDDLSTEPGAYTDRGEAAESAAYTDEGAYSGGEFAGGQVTGES
jgi:hypothetical protein